jgi:hypothetical protein
MFLLTIRNDKEIVPMAKITAFPGSQTSDRKIIDLDELIPATQYVRLDGKEHAVEPASVEMYLTVMHKRGKMKDANTEFEQIRESIDLIALACPTISRERLGKLPLRALTKLTDIIQEQMTDEAEGEDGANAPEPNTETGE